MYHPPRGGVRGGADQFNWEDIKSDKHRENYLGHSVKAPVGRWQKGKDLLWYSKDRSSGKDGMSKSDSSEISAIKLAEEEAMLAALGHKIVRKETQPLTKEEMTEVLKRNTAERDALNVERVEGVGVMSARAAMLVNSGSQKRSKADGISFEAPSCGIKNVNTCPDDEKQRSHERKVSSRKHKKEKKHKKKKKHKWKSSGSDSGDGENDKSSFSKTVDRGKRFDEASRSSFSNYRSKINEGCSQKSHKSSEEMRRDAKLKTRKSRHDSSSECESYLESHSKSGHRSKRKRHDSTSGSD